MRRGLSGELEKDKPYIESAHGQLEVLVCRGVTLTGCIILQQGRK